ncbi:hypothetical protein BDV34DRAFT_194732 [Aspergillus parasiticus]|uniref:Uncharacterized protein n=1 Tax=Aspergillus parasiticus TaxID=5067 RepID=A0A5N6DLR9_ASPPA|nr:hypothetical protein BDV34DRAFT_194732 [Aspergillus parasiticus]
MSCVANNKCRCSVVKDKSKMFQSSFAIHSACLTRFAYSLYSLIEHGLFQSRLAPVEPHDYGDRLVGLALLYCGYHLDEDYVYPTLK